MLFKNVSMYKMKSFKVVRETGKGGGKYGMGRRGKGPKDSFRDINCGIVLILARIPRPWVSKHFPC